MDISSAHHIQQSLFYGEDARGKSTRIMHALDEINQRFGRGTLRVAVTGATSIWQPKAECLSQKYTTDWEQLPIVYAE